MMRHQTLCSILLLTLLTHKIFAPNFSCPTEGLISFSPQSEGPSKSIDLKSLLSSKEALIVLIPLSYIGYKLAVKTYNSYQLNTIQKTQIEHVGISSDNNYKLTKLKKTGEELQQQLSQQHKNIKTEFCNAHSHRENLHQKVISQFQQLKNMYLPGFEQTHI